MKPLSYNQFVTGLWLILGAALIVVCLMLAGQRREIVRLKAYSDSVTVVAAARDSASTAQARRDSLTVDSLQSTKHATDVRLVVSRAKRDSLQNALVVGLESAHDTIVNQAAQLAEADTTIAGLKANAKADSLSLWVALARGNRLLDSLHAQTATIVSLNAKVQRLNAHAWPKWIRVSFGIAEKTLAVKGLADVVRGK